MSDSFPDIKYKFKNALGNTHLFASWTSRISYKAMKQFKEEEKKKNSESNDEPKQN